MPAEIHHRARLRWLSRLAYRLGLANVGAVLDTAGRHPSLIYARSDREWAARIRRGREPGAHVAALLLESGADETEGMFRALARRAP